jgi:hypothetical protein
MEDVTQQAQIRIGGDIYASAALGSFALGVADLLRNTQSSTVVRLQEIFKQLLPLPDFGLGAWVALSVVVILGTLLCWVHRPADRVEGFARGATVFAVLNILSPAAQVPVGLVTGPPGPQLGALSTKNGDRLGRSRFVDLLVPSAAAGQASAQTATEPADHYGKAIVILRAAASDGGPIPENAIVTLRNPTTAQIVAQQRVARSTFLIQQPLGQYRLQVEAEGFRRTEALLTIDKDEAGYELPLAESSIPINVQLLMGHSTADLRRVNLAEAESTLSKGYYTQLVEEYAEKIKREPNNPRAHTDEGYALYRTERYDEALKELDRALKLQPSYWFARLNKAKVLCTRGEFEAALKSLKGDERELSASELKDIRSDGEFQQKCKDIMPNVVSE